MMDRTIGLIGIVEDLISGMDNDMLVYSDDNSVAVARNLGAIRATVNLLKYHAHDALDYCQNIENSNSDFRHENWELKKELMGLKDDIEELEGARDLYKEQVAEAVSDYDKAMDTIDDLIQEKEELTNKNQYLRADYNRLDEHYDELLLEKEDLEQEFKENCNAWYTEKIKLKEKNGELEKVCNDLTNPNEELMNENDILRKDKEELNEKARYFEKSVHYLEVCNTDLRKEKKELKKEVDELKVVYDGAIEDQLMLADKIDELEEANKQLSESLEAEKEKANQWAHKYTELDKQGVIKLKALHNEFEKNEGHVCKAVFDNEEYEKLKKENEALKRECTEWKDKFQKADSELRDFMNDDKVKELAYNMDACINTIDNREKDISTLKVKLHDLEKKNLNLRKEIERLKGVDKDGDDE